MKYVEVVVASGSLDTISAIAEKAKALDCRVNDVSNDGMQSIRMVVSDDKTQWVLDALQTVLGAQPTAKIVVMPVETYLPRPEVSKPQAKDKATQTREALYDEVAKNAVLDRNFIVLVVLSTLVAGIGLIEDNVAVVIGAMVIAPLLGPNLALSLGTALGDLKLMREASVTLLMGATIAISLSILIGHFLLPVTYSQELMSRTVVGIDTVVLALASGAAAALSITTGLSSVLVGVMVAVALLPPAATVGIMISAGEWDYAIGASLLLGVNIVCVNLVSKVVFFVQGINPRTWLEQEKAKKSMGLYVAGWIVSLVLLMLIVFIRDGTLVPSVVS